MGASKKDSDNFSFTAEEVLAVAVAVYKLHEPMGGYVRESYMPTTDEQLAQLPANYSGKYGEDVYVYSNKTIVREYFIKGSGAMRYAPENSNVPVLEVTDEDRAEANEIVAYYQKALMFKSLNGDIEEDVVKGKTFNSTLMNILDKEKVSFSDCGILSCIPLSYRNEKEKDKRRSRMNQLAMSSDYIGKVGEEVELDIEIVSYTYVDKFGCHVYTCFTPDDNVVTFFTQKTPEVFGDHCRIKAKVKRVGVSNFSKAKETTLNYVKVVS